MKKINVYSYFNPPPNCVYSGSGSSPSLTDQSFKDECDINNIIARFHSSGILPQSVDKPMYGDFTDVPTYQESCDLVMKIDSLFSSLPAVVRSRFSNDPCQLLYFLEDPANRDEAVSLGLCTFVDNSKSEVVDEKEG